MKIITLVLVALFAIACTPTRKNVRRTTGVTMTTTTAALPGAFVLMAIDGKGTCTLEPPQEECPRLYDTAPTGKAIIIGAAAVYFVGLVILWVTDHSRDAMYSKRNHELQK